MAEQQIIFVQRDKPPQPPPRGRVSLFADENGELKRINPNGEVAEIGGAGEPGPQGEQGIQGDPGPKGDQGEPGAAGAAATITVGSVTTGDPGTDAEVTNSGTESAAILNFVIPRGDSGASGINGAITLFGSTTLASDASDVVFTAIPSVAKGLRVVFQAKSNYAGDIFDSLVMEFNGDTTSSNYVSSYDFGGTSSGGGNASGGSGNNICSITASNTSNPAQFAASGAIDIPNYTGTVFHKQWTGGVSDHRSGTFFYTFNIAGRWGNTDVINQIRFRPRNGSSFKAGTHFSLYLVG